ncbi:MAG: hypothetical protein H0X36_13455, partial [Sphingomonadaceae bacterium]|nr:hypothetical protein [Sphingomonadaceae bacterium]
ANGAACGSLTARRRQSGQDGPGRVGCMNEPASIMKALDLGAYGIIVPLVNTAAEAAMAVVACRYPPVGMRSSGPTRAVHTTATPTTEPTPTTRLSSWP